MAKITNYYFYYYCYYNHYYLHLTCRKYRRASVLRGAGRRWAWGLRAWISAVHFARIVEARLNLLKMATTVTCFLVFLVLLPALLFVYSGE